MYFLQLTWQQNTITTTHHPCKLVICISLITNEGEHLKKYTACICILSLGNCLLKTFYPLFYGREGASPFPVDLYGFVNYSKLFKFLTVFCKGFCKFTTHPFMLLWFCCFLSHKALINFYMVQSALWFLVLESWSKDSPTPTPKFMKIFTSKATR